MLTRRHEAGCSIDRHSGNATASTGELAAAQPERYLHSTLQLLVPRPSLDCTASPTTTTTRQLHGC